MKYTTNFKGDTIKDPMRNLSLEDLDISYWKNLCREYEERIDKATEYIKDKNIVVGTDMDGNLYSSKDILIGILKGEDY